MRPFHWLAWMRKTRSAACDWPERGDRIHSADGGLLAFLQCFECGVFAKRGREAGSREKERRASIASAYSNDEHEVTHRRLTRRMVDQRVIGLLLLVVSVATGVYLFFQTAPEAKLCVWFLFACVCMERSRCLCESVVAMTRRSVRHAFSSRYFRYVRKVGIPFHVESVVDPVIANTNVWECHFHSEECEPISISYVISGVLPTWMNGRNDKMGTVQGLWACANQYKAQNPGFVLASFCIVYITLQTFAIPGPIVLSILSGAMYPFLQAQLLVSFCATTGASLCFALSYFLGRGVFNRLFSSMIAKFKEKIAQNQSNLFYYLLFLRITPLLPNWFVNIASPLVDVKFKYFFLATLIGRRLLHLFFAAVYICQLRVLDVFSCCFIVGLIPANFLHISTGATLNSAAGDSGGSNALNFAILFSLQFVALLPTLFKSKIESYEKRAFEKAKTK